MRVRVPVSCRRYLISGAVLLSGQLLALGVFTLVVGHFLTKVDTFSQADAIVVLGGDGGDFQRSRQAVRLFDAGHAPVVVFSGGTLENAGLACSSAQMSLEAARELGLPKGAAMIADGAHSTYDEAVNLHQLTQEHDWRSLIIVTDPFHTRRAGRAFRALLPDVTIYTSAASNPHHDPDRWWRTEDGLVAVFSETIKLAFYWARYGITPF